MLTLHLGFDELVDLGSAPFCAVAVTTKIRSSAAAHVMFFVQKDMVILQEVGVYAVADDALNDHWDASLRSRATSICG
jgi:hypothetical protein